MRADTPRCGSKYPVLSKDLKFEGKVLDIRALRELSSQLRTNEFDRTNSDHVIFTEGKSDWP